MTSQDVAARFVAYRTKRTVWRFSARIGCGSKGIRVNQGQVILILARLASDQAQVYALEFARQSLTNAVVFYKTPQ